MDDTKHGHPEERAFTGHSDHPPAEPDQPAQENEELLRDPGDGGGEADVNADSRHEEGKSPGDQGTNLPGYG